MVRCLLHAFQIEFPESYSGDVPNSASFIIHSKKSFISYSMSGDYLYFNCYFTRNALSYETINIVNDRFAKWKPFSSEILDS